MALSISLSHESTHAESPATLTVGHAQGCFHGGAFFEAIGEEFDRLERRTSVINADVLDAWFPPAPGVLEALREHLAWIVRTSPPTNADGLIRAIARTRGVPRESIVVGGGSSDLIFLALTHWLRRESRVLLLDPTYGEYAHVLQQVVGCHVDRFGLCRSAGYRVSPTDLSRALSRGYDLVVLVNPNSPTGRHLPLSDLLEVLSHVPQRTRVWVDETYGEYVGAGESLERFAAASENFVVCKSMSKVYALSGVRVAYCVAPPALAAPLRQRTPPWAVSLPAQIAAVNALRDPDYYAARYRETHALRESLATQVAMLGGIEVIPGVANFILCQLAPERPAATEVVAACRERNVFIRDAAQMSRSLGDRAVRIAVKDAASNERILEVLREALEEPRHLPISKVR